MYSELSVDELKNLKYKLQKEYENFKTRDLKLDMSRGKPCDEQLEISKPILDMVSSNNKLVSQDGTNYMNYGGLDGLDEMKTIFANLFEVQNKNVIVGGNSSLTMMFDFLNQCYIKGNGKEPWCKNEKVKFICPVPGYDRHFSITEYLDIEMINVPMTTKGPDMDMVEELVKDESVKGIWCVPKYSNPTGISYSNETVKRLASMKTADDFVIIWDNAYCVHHLSDNKDEILNIYDECKKAGNENRVVMFASTSKVTFPGSGISALATSDDNIKRIKARLTVQTIGPDKINQLRHILFLKDSNNIEEHMKKHAEIIGPRFELVLKEFDSQLGKHGIASWVKPNGGYFISLDVMDGCAKRVFSLCKEAGVKLTNCGDTFPYGIDDRDTNIRIAPTYPSLDELNTAVNLLCICVKLASVEKLLSQK